jgi:hypothetical protein
VGVWGLFSDPYEKDPKTEERRLNRAGWTKVVLLTVGFLLFAITDMHERNESVAARERQSQQLLMQEQTITNQDKNLDYLRELLLSQHRLSEVEITLAFPEETTRTFTEGIYQFARGQPDEHSLNRSRLAYIATACRVGALVRFGGKESGHIEYALNRPQGLISDRVTDHDPEWLAFTTAFGGLFGDGFEIQTETGRVLFDLLMPEQPMTIKFQRDGVVLNVKNAGIRFDELRGAVTFVCGKDKLLFVNQESIDEEEPRRVEPMRFGPTRIRLKSRDPRVTWDQEITCDWHANVTRRIHEVDTDTTAEIGHWRSENHAITATLSGIEPE